MKIRSKGESYATGRNFGIVFIYRRPGNVSIRHACNGERPAAFCGRKDAAADEFLTQNRLMAILVGTLVTAVIQSSSATTVMVVGFVNAGMLNLSQAVGVIMGANIGTTITAWLVSLSEFGSF